LEKETADKSYYYRAFTFNELLNYFRNLTPESLINTRCYIELDNYSQPKSVCIILYDAWDYKLHTVNRKQPQEAAAELALWAVKEVPINLKRRDDV